MTGSVDTTVKVWDLKDDEPIDVIYDHEEQVSVMASANATANNSILFASMDAEGKVLVKMSEVTEADNTFEVESARESYESGCILFNCLKANELFITFNEKLHIYDIEGN